MQAQEAQNSRVCSILAYYGTTVAQDAMLLPLQLGQRKGVAFRSDFAAARARGKLEDTFLCTHTYTRSPPKIFVPDRFLSVMGHG